MPKASVNHKVFSIPKSILWTGKILNFFSNKWARDFAFKIFITPHKFPRPSREQKMYQKAEKQRVYIKPLQKEIQLYHCGSGDKKVLLVHGWAGRGTQLHAIAQTLAEQGFHAISFDATAHGDSEGKVSSMAEFIVCIKELEKTLGHFEYGVGHSLGAMALTNSVADGLNIKKMVTIGCADSITDICMNFVRRLELKPKVGLLLKQKLDVRYGSDIEKLSTGVAAEKIQIPVLLMHDTQDEDVPVKLVYDISTKLKNKELYITEGLGHRRILWDKNVLAKIKDFFTN